VFECRVSFVDHLKPGIRFLNKALLCAKVQRRDTGLWNKLTFFLQGTNDRSWVESGRKLLGHFSHS
jgi:hypothetical protein